MRTSSAKTLALALNFEASLTEGRIVENVKEMLKDENQLMKYCQDEFAKANAEPYPYHAHMSSYIKKILDDGRSNLHIKSGSWNVNLSQLLISPPNSKSKDHCQDRVQFLA